MSIITFVFVLGFISFGLVAINVYLTYEAIRWIPFSIRKRIGLCVLIWLAPLIGAIIAAKQLKLIFSSKTAYSSGGSGAFVEMDAIFNPQARHYIEYKQEKSSIVVKNEQADDINKNLKL